MGKGDRTIPKLQGCMRKAGRVLRDVLNTYGISQNKLAIAMGVRSSVVYRWFNELIDPTVNTLVKMVVALKLLDIDAAREFVQRYWGEILEDEGGGEVDRSTNTE
ncbi:helix-turn-helix transcriptional regulator [Microcoleus sp. w2-18bC1]|uniref:helix-turn-helix transcriptional regulator n=1 Tax=unclassified Microcoleus TaxID=2642155 RepID=UPI002FD5A206